MSASERRKIKNRLKLEYFVGGVLTTIFIITMVITIYGFIAR